MSNLSNKSGILQLAAKMLHDNSLYPAVAHDAYYSCYQLMKHMWLYSMGRSQRELDTKCSLANAKSHECLLNEIVLYIKNTKGKNSLEDSRLLRNNVPQLKRLRTDADYNDELFDVSKSSDSLVLSNRIIKVLKKY